MITLDGLYEVCDNPSCLAKIQNNPFARIKAEFWFFMRSGKAFCPEHIPAWLAEYRKRKLKEE